MSAASAHTQALLKLLCDCTVRLKPKMLFFLYTSKLPLGKYHLYLKIHPFLVIELFTHNAFYTFVLYNSSNKYCQNDTTTDTCRNRKYKWCIVRAILQHSTGMEAVCRDKTFPLGCGMWTRNTRRTLVFFLPISVSPFRSSMSELRSFKIPAQSILEIGEDGQMDHKRNGRKSIKLLPKYTL